MFSAGWEAWFTLAVIGGMMVVLIREILRPDFALLTGVGVLLVAGVIDPPLAFSGFSNPAVMTVAALFVVAGGVTRTGAFDFLDRLMAGGGASGPSLMARVMAPTVAFSAFFNNTPIVAMLIPRVQSVAARLGFSSSRVLIPLSYAAIVGGMITVLGTSINLLASGYLQQTGERGFTLFELAWIGLPAAVLVIAYFALIGHKLLPDHLMPRPEGLIRKYHFEVRLPYGSVLAGRTIAEAELRALRDAYLTHVRRQESVFQAAPDERLQEGDILAFTGDPDLLDDLVDREGLERVMNGVAVPDVQSHLIQYDAVVSANSGLVGRTLKDVAFREKYQGIVLAIHRRDREISSGLGSVPLEPGDLLLVEALAGFDRRYNQSGGDFYLVAPRKRVEISRSAKAPVAMGLFVTMILLTISGVMPLVTAAFLAALLMIFTRCLRLDEARRMVDIPILLMMAAALGLGRAVEASGLADMVGFGVVTVGSGFGVLGVLVALYVATNLLTEIITNAAAVILMLPVGIASAHQLGIDPHGFAIAVTIAASASFLSPIGYQTNLMVMSVGSYRFGDYFRAGIGVSLIVMVVTIAVVWWRWL